MDILGEHIHSYLSLSILSWQIREIILSGLLIQALSRRFRFLNKGILYFSKGK